MVKLGGYAYSKGFTSTENPFMKPLNGSTRVFNKYIKLDLYSE